MSPLRHVHGHCCPRLTRPEGTPNRGVKPMPKGNFTSAKLQSDGTVSVVGPFSPGPGDPLDRPMVLGFYLVQDSTEAGGKPTKVDGTGGWWAGQTDWFGAGGTGLKPGPAQATAIAILPHDEPPAFVTFTWNDTVEVE